MCLSKSGHHTNSIDDSTGIVVSQFTSYGQSALLLLFLSREPGNGYMHDALPSLLRGCIGYLSSGIWLPSNSGVKWGESKVAVGLLFLHGRKKISWDLKELNTTEKLTHIDIDR